MLKSDAFSASIFKGFGPHFRRFLGTLGSLKMSISSRQNTDFHVFYPRKCDLDFGSILGRFWEGFGRPTSLIFAFFSVFFRCKIWSAIWKGKQSKKKRKGNRLPPLGARSAVIWRLLGRKIGWVQDLRSSFQSSTLRTPSVGGGLKTPGGGSPPPTHPWQFGHLVIEFLFGRFLAVLGVRGSI